LLAGDDAQENPTTMTPSDLFNDDDNGSARLMAQLIWKADLLRFHKRVLREESNDNNNRKRIQDTDRGEIAGV
jgi:hypothetical protein